MEKLTLVKLENMDGWREVNKEDIVKSFDGCGMREVPEDVVKKYNIKEGDKIQELKDKFGEELEDALYDSDFVKTYTNGYPYENYIILNDIDENGLYFDGCSEEFYTGDTALEWDTDEFYHFWDGHNWRMYFIEEKKEVEAEKIDVSHYDTGNIIKYKLKNGKIFTLDNSLYQGSINAVLEDDIIDEI